MRPKAKPVSQLGFYTTFEEQLSHKHLLYILSGQVNWQVFEDAFLPLYSTEGRPAKPIRLMVALLILKHLRNLSDEGVVEQWAENSYYQYFSGERCFAAGAPCEASELVHFRKRIGEAGMALIFKESIRINGGDSQEDSIIVDTTVKEKAITFPTDDKLYKKIIAKCGKIAASEGLPVRQSYRYVLKELGYAQRFRNHPKNRGKARAADRKVKTIAGRLVRELERNLTPDTRHLSALELFKKVLSQKRSDSGKIYSLHEPDVQCISKGKDYKKYEFGNKASIAYTQTTGVIVGAKGFRAEYDGHTLEAALEQVEQLTGKRPLTVTADRGYRGRSRIGSTAVQIPKPFAKGLSRYRQDKLKRAFRRRAAIEPVISHVKSDHRMMRNFYKGIVGDNINILLSAAAFNFKRIMNKWKNDFLTLFQNLIVILNFMSRRRQSNATNPTMAF